MIEVPNEVPRMVAAAKAVRSGVAGSNGMSGWDMAELFSAMILTAFPNVPGEADEGGRWDENGEDPEE